MVSPLHIERRIKMAKSKEEKEQDKIANDKRLASVMCKCTNRVPFHSFNRKGWAVCNIYGARVVKPIDEFKNRLKEMLEVK